MLITGQAYAYHMHIRQKSIHRVFSCCRTVAGNYGIGGNSSFHDALYIRKMLNLKPAPEFEAWLMQQGIMDGNGNHLLADAKYSEVLYNKLLPA